MVDPERLSIANSSSHFEVLDAAAEHLDTTSWLDMSDVGLAPPYREFLERDPHPLPTPGDREGYYGERHLDYWLSGLRDSLLLRERLRQRDLAIGPEEAVLDLGCASGRVSRHLWCQLGHQDLWCADIKARHLEWIRRHLPDRIKLLPNTILPQLPIADHSLGLVCAFSVFTHIDQHELGWLAELRRVLRPGGVAYLTAHTERTWARLDPKIKLYDTLLRVGREESLGLDITAEHLARPMPAERLVFDPARLYGTNVFHSTDYLHRTWGRLFDVIDLIDAGAQYQDVVILRNR